MKIPTLDNLRAATDDIGLIFDFDGTLADSMDVWYHVDRMFLARRNLTPPPDYGKKLSTLGFDRAAEYVIEHFGLTEKPAEIMEEWNDLALGFYRDDVKLKPHVREYLGAVHELPHIHSAVATTLDIPLLEAALKSNGIEPLFEVLTHGFEVEHDKREPDIYLLAAERLGIEPKSCIVFEDILPGIQSAKRAGMAAIGVRDNSGHQEMSEMKAHSDAFIDSFAELL